MSDIVIIALLNVIPAVISVVGGVMLLVFVLKNRPDGSPPEVIKGPVKRCGCGRKYGRCRRRPKGQTGRKHPKRRAKDGKQGNRRHC